MKPFIKIALLLLIVCPNISFGQTYFNMLYPPETGTYGSGTRSVVVTDSAYYMNRWAADDLYGMLWHGFTKVSLNGMNHEVADTVHQTYQWISFAGLTPDQDGGFVDASSIADSSGTRQYGIVKYNSLGQIIFHNKDTTLYPYLYLKQIISLPDGSFVSVGDVRLIPNSPPHAQYIVLIKSDSLGNQIWIKTYSIGPLAENGESVALCSDGGFIIGGTEINYSVQDWFYSPIVIKTDSNGNAQWKRKYGSTEFSNWPAYGITQTQDGGYAFCGGVGVFDTLNSDMQMPWVVKLNVGGYIVWADTNIDNTLVSINNLYHDIVELEDGSLVACGQQLIGYPRVGTINEYKKKGLIKKLNSNGNPLWTRYYSHPDIVYSSKTHVLYDIDTTPDGGFVAAGYAFFTADTVQSTWLIKVDGFGCLVPGCELKKADSLQSSIPDKDINSVSETESSIAALKIYPNPTSSQLNIEITLRVPQGSQNKYVFELYDLLGKRVLVKTLYPQQNTINVSHLASGVYTYKIGAIWGYVVKE